MIKQAIIPLAGLGTRMLPLTSVMPKELMPINGKPNLQYILDECIDAGVKEFVFIISKKKLSIKKYFFNDNFYKKIIKKKKDKRLIEEFKKIKRYQKMIKFVYQNKPKGTGDAVLRCQKYIKNKYFLMLLPDDLIIRNNCSKEMIQLHKKIKGSIISISSQLGHIGAYNRTLYCLSKFGLEGMTKSMALDLAKYGIRAVTVAPTKTLVRPFEQKKTPGRLNLIKKKIPLNKFSTKSEIASIVFFLTTSAAKSITGTSIISDGGWTAGK